MTIASRPEWALWRFDHWGFYIPEFIWRFWVDANPMDSKPWTGVPYGLHIYDVYNDVVNIGCDSNLPCSTIFHHIEKDVPALLSQPIWHEANAAFVSLEKEAETAIRSLLQQVNSGRPPSGVPDARGRAKLSMGRHSLQVLMKYLTFLQFRNSLKFCELLENAGCGQAHDGPCTCDGALSRWLVVLAGFTEYLGGNNGGKCSPEFDHVYESIHEKYRDIQDAEICVGMAAESDEYILKASCFGILEEDGSGNLDHSHTYFFPITPRFTLYLLLDISGSPLPNRDSPLLSCDCPSAEDVDYDVESSIDVYQRNSLLLQTLPRFVIYASERSMIRSIQYYDQRKWLPENLDYSKLLRGCRQESVTYTLLVKASIDVIDLTDDVTRIGEGPIAHGAFADVWKGIWKDRNDKNRSKLVALKVLRTVMMKNVQETLLKRLRDEVLAWHRLEHPNIAPLYGVMQLPSTLAMVSPWCDNGTIVKYLKEKNPGADRLRLLHEIAAGVLYLHTRSPCIIHGDLKGGNILINHRGSAIITDFGLARVIEEVSDVTQTKTTSFFAGSTRWMAPELLLALVEEDVRAPPLSKYSDVYAFASVCLEVLTDELPYSHRRNDHGVTLDVMRGIKPSRSAACKVDEARIEDLLELMDKCWDQFPRTRPSMEEMISCIERHRGASA
ncbi:kinase-like protein [Rickenella mellea]|uniref:Kinase-like protein n=1 Tax=Rickenella mellea TaxID=50990 RepID=A0A4Y7PGZ6_9AGAM|nr:kinase-like protein [Rickenella mellea]